MDILSEIVEHKHKEVEQRKAAIPVGTLEKSEFFGLDIISLKSAVTQKDASGIIAEFKRRSPSKGSINDKASIEHVSVGYRDAGASAMSVLTDEKYFGGSSVDLIKARRLNNFPILRKDFIVDEYQVIEAKSIGADAILLIAASLPVATSIKLSRFARSLALEILLEVHNEEELNLTQEVERDLVGVNNRNLRTFTVSLDTSRSLITKIPKDVPAVSESGIEHPQTINELKSIGYSGFLIGQSFMQTESPGLACAEFIKELNSGD